VDATEQEINPDYEAMLEMEARSVSDVADVAANLTMARCSTLRTWPRRQVTSSWQ